MVSQGLNSDQLQGLFVDAVSINGTVIATVRDITVQIGVDGLPAQQPKGKG